MAVRRMRDDPKAHDARRRAVMRFVIWETVGFVPFILALIWLHIAGPERPADEAMRLTAIAAGAFAIYVGILFVLILLPAFRGSSDAR